MRLLPVSGVPYNARCDYLHRSIELNTDPILTRPGLKHLAVHEGYPGHYVQFKLREKAVREGAAPADGLLSVVNTASSSVFEGIADAGIAMLEWLETDDDQLQALMNRYRAGIGTGAAWRLHALGWPAERVADWLHSRSLAGGEGWVQNRMKFIAAPARAVLDLVVLVGRAHGSRSVGACSPPNAGLSSWTTSTAACTPTRRWACFLSREGATWAGSVGQPRTLRKP